MCPRCVLTEVWPRCPRCGDRDSAEVSQDRGVVDVSEVYRDRVGPRSPRCVVTQAVRPPENLQWTRWGDWRRPGGVPRPCRTRWARLDRFTVSNNGTGIQTHPSAVRFQYVGTVYGQTVMPLCHHPNVACYFRH